MTQLPIQNPSLITVTPSLNSENPAENFSIDVDKSAAVEVESIVTKNGIGFSISNQKFFLSYPPKIWSLYPAAQQQILADNLAFCFTFFLPYLITEIKKINYHMPVPLADPFLFKGFSYAIPAIALLDQQLNKDRTTINLLRKLFEIDFCFTSKKTLLPKFRRSSDPSHVVMPFTFGKDSLLTFALCREIGLTVYPIYIAEPHYQFEYELKKGLAKDFKKDIGIDVDFLNNTFGVLREPGEGSLGWELILTHYSLMLLPYVYAYNASFVFFANEQSCNETVLDKEGFRCNPVFEQSAQWLVQNSLMASLIGGNSLSIGSILEPLNDLAIIKILHTRYPDIAKYQMSCDPEDKDKVKLGDQRWCENCSKCARIYIFLLANGFDPKTVGFVHDLLDQKYIHLYTLFGADKKTSYGYDASGVGREEQMFAFYLAYKRGIRSKLMEIFAEKYLPGLSEREAELRKKFYGIHSSTTTPDIFRDKLLHIYRKELDPLHS